MSHYNHNMHVFLKLVNGEQIEQTIESNVCIIGRSAKCDVVVPHDGMSRQHCQIEVVEGEVFVTDLGSTNGVLIDGEKIVPNEKTPYALYLSLSFGAVQSMQIELEELKGGSLNNRSAPLRDSTNPNASSGGTSLTKTKTMREVLGNKEAKVSARPMPTPQAKDSKAQMWMMNILALVILAGAVWWYTTKDDTPLETPDQIEMDAPQVPEKPYDQF